MKKLILNSAPLIVLIAAISASLYLMPDFQKRMFGQFLSIAACGIVSVAAHMNGDCPRRKVGRWFISLFREDKVRRFFRLIRTKEGAQLALRGSAIVWGKATLSKQEVANLLIGVGSTLLVIGLTAQVFSNQVADKPITFHLAIPLLCIPLFWIVTNKLIIGNDKITGDK